MLRTLLESARPHSIPLGSLVASIALHAALGVPAWTGTPTASVATTPESFITRVLFMPPPDRVASRSAGAERLRWVALGAPSGGQGYFVPDSPRASRLGGTLLDRIAAAPPGSPGDERRSDPPVAGNDSAYSILQVDEMVVRYADSAAPLYPTDLLERSMEGVVRVRYVVGVAGRVDTSNVEVLRSTHPRFTEAVVNALAGMRFHPATIAGAPVSQVVEQDFGFRIEPRTADPAGRQVRDTARADSPHQ